MYYIDTRRRVWNEETFFAEGKSQAQTLLSVALRPLEFDPTGKRILEIGCGIGRLFPGFADLFEETWGVDVSAAMIEQGRRICPAQNARFVLGNGQDLGEIPSTYFDYCFSYIVFQHVPDMDILWNYLSETYRVLRPGGAFQLHFRSTTPLTTRLLRRLPHRIRYWASKMRSNPFSGSSSTWTGVAVSPQQVVARLSSNGFTTIQIVPCHSFRHDSFWAIGRKPRLT